jgi:hypothetical protein
MIQSYLEKRTNKKVPVVLEGLESLLCFDAWLNHWETSNPARVAMEMAKHQDSQKGTYNTSFAADTNKAHQQESNQIIEILMTTVKV